jgi:hypothetical protein
MRKAAARALAVAAALAIVTWVGVARADKVDDLMGRLRGDADYKVRLTAALSLGRLGDRRAIPALVDGLADPDKSVRLVAAGALGKLVDAGAPPDQRSQVMAALEGAARDDAEDSVRIQAQRSLAALRSLPAPPTTPVGHGVYIEVGAMADKTARGGAVLPLMRQTIVASLQKRAPTYQLAWPTGHSPTELDLRRAGTTAFFVDASVTRLDTSGGRVGCAVSMILATYPQKSMFGFLNGSAEVDAGSTSERAVNAALTDCLSAVLDDLVGTKIVPTIRSRSP